MATKLNQIVALVKGKKGRIAKLLTQVHHSWKADKLTGMSRTYLPVADGGVVYPPESKHVQLVTMTQLQSILPQLADFYNVIATQEKNNCHTRADVIVDGAVLISGVPVSLLMFLDKQLISLHTLISELPVLDPDKIWTFDEAKGLYVTEPAQSTKMKKVPQVITKAPATKEHPAQTEVFTSDLPEGFWTTVISSGAIPLTQKDAMLSKVVALRDAVKVAREEANNIDVVPETALGSVVLSYVFQS